MSKHARIPALGYGALEDEEECPKFGSFSSMLIDNADHATWMGTALVCPRLICKLILTGPAGNWGRGARV